MKLIPFLNAHLQGLDKAWRTIGQPIVDAMRGHQVFADDPSKLNNAIFAAVKAVGVFGVFGAMWAAIFGDNRGYRNSTPYAKGTHLIVPVGSRQLWIPKPFELSLGFTAGEYAFQRLAQDDPRAASMFASAAWQILEPPSDIPLLKTGYELAANYNLFAGRPIVPQNLQRLTPAEQYNEHTSSLSKMLGNAIGVSPVKVDYAIGSLFGNWGRDIMTLSQVPRRQRIWSSPAGRRHGGGARCISSGAVRTKASGRFRRSNSSNWMASRAGRCPQSTSRWTRTISSAT